ncbi:glycosyltransferase [Lachnospiraceae bacterium 62-35]
MTVDVVIPAYRPGNKFQKLLAMLQVQEAPVNKIIVINTEEKYWRPEDYKDYGNLEVHHISKSQFDHGASRNMGIGFSESEIVVCMTDDAIPADKRLISSLIKGFSEKGPQGESVVEVYGRQLAGKDCSEAERYTRSFNYPAQSKIKTIKDLDEMGIKTFFASNVCCAYKRENFKRLGGFINRTIFNEDMIFASKVLKAGYAIAYAAEAKVIHSHSYTPVQQFHRNFDLGVSQADHPEVFQGISSEGEGIRLIRQTTRYLMRKKRFQEIPGMIISSGFKYMGFQLGRHYRSLPKGIVKKMSMNQSYWDREER